MHPLFNDMPAPLPKPHRLTAEATTEPIPTDDDHVTIRIRNLLTPAEWQKRKRNPSTNATRQSQMGHSHWSKQEANHCKPIHNGHKRTHSQTYH